MFLPGPDALEESVSPEVITGEALLDTQLFLHLDLRGNARMVNSREPKRRIALHALVTREDVLQGRVNGVAEMQLARDVGGRHHDAERLLLRVDLGAEIISVHPEVIDLFLDLFGVIHFRKFLHTELLLIWNLSGRICAETQKRPEENLRAAKITVVPPEFR